MRIGVDIRCLMDGKRTGVEEYTLGVLRAMLADDREDTFVLFANSRKPMRLPEFNAPNVELRAFNYPNTFFNFSLKVLELPSLDRLLGGLDVLFVPSVRLAPTTVSCPVVVTVHDLSFVRHAEYFSLYRRLWHWFMEPRQLARRAARVIAVSQKTADDIHQLYGVHESSIRVIHSGIGAHMLPVPRNSLRAHQVRNVYNLPDRFLLFLGTLEPRKNLRGLVDAYVSARQKGVSHHLVLAGERGWIHESFFDDVRNSPYAADIHFTGVVQDADKPALYSLADLFVYPSFYEGFGFPPLEALACGTPVITSYNSAIPEIAGEWALLINPFDTNELAAVLMETLAAPARIPSHVSAALHQRYAWERAGRETLAVLSEAAEQHVFATRLRREALYAHRH